jgi:hypothetical protein
MWSLAVDKKKAKLATMHNLTAWSRFGLKRVLGAAFQNDVCQFENHPNKRKRCPHYQVSAPFPEAESNLAHNPALFALLTLLTLPATLEKAMEMHIIVELCLN